MERGEMVEPRWKVLARQKGVNPGRVVKAFIDYYMAQQEIPTLQRLAEMLEVHPATLSWWRSENDQARSVPENKTIARLAEVFGCTQDDVREAFGLREPLPPVDAQTQEILEIVYRLSPADKELIRASAWTLLERQRQAENHNTPMPV